MKKSMFSLAIAALIVLPLQGDPAGPVLVQQLKSAGFNVVFQALQSAAQNDATLRQAGGQRVVTFSPPVAWSCS